MLVTYTAADAMNYNPFKRFSIWVHNKGKRQSFQANPDDGKMIVTAYMSTTESGCLCA